VCGDVLRFYSQNMIRHWCYFTTVNVEEKRQNNALLDVFRFSDEE
jgi:hypothetical protein